MCTKCNKINNQIQKLAFNKRSTCSRGDCFNQSGYLIKGKHYCFNHARQLKVFSEFKEMKEKGCEHKKTNDYNDSRLGLLNALFDSALQSVKE